MNKIGTNHQDLAMGL